MGLVDVGALRRLYAARGRELMTVAGLPLAARPDFRPFPGTRPAVAQGLSLLSFERPVLDCEGLLVVQGDETAQSRGGAHDADGAVIEIAREPRGLERPGRRDEPDPLDEDDSGARVPDELVRPVALEELDFTAPAILPSAARCAPSAPRHRRCRGRRPPRRDGGACARGDRGTRRPPARAAGPRAADELEHGGGGVGLQDPRAVARDGPAQRGRTAASTSSVTASPSGSTARPPNARALRALRDERRGAVDRIERRRVRLLGRLAPGDEAVLGEQDELASGAPRQRPRRASRARTLAGGTESRCARSRSTRGEPLALDGADDGADRVRVGVVDVRMRDERVQQRLDRRARHRGVELAAREVRDHLRVAHRVAPASGAISSSRRPAKPAARDRREVAARSLHPEDARSRGPRGRPRAA